MQNADPAQLKSPARAARTSGAPRARPPRRPRRRPRRRSDNARSTPLGLPRSARHRSTLSCARAATACRTPPALKTRWRRGLTAVRHSRRAQLNGLNRNGSRLPPTIGRARPKMCLTTFTNRPGTPIATNRNPTRTIIAASTSCGTRGRLGSAASAKNKMPSGHRNQPDLPKSVIWSKDQTIQRGRWPTPLIAAASTKNIVSRKITKASPAAMANCCGASGHGFRT